LKMFEFTQKCLNMFNDVLICLCVCLTNVHKKYKLTLVAVFAFVGFVLTSIQKCIHM
jgi:hypothetical protein